MWQHGVPNPQKCSANKTASIYDSKSTTRCQGHLQSGVLAVRSVRYSPSCSVLLQKCVHGLAQRESLIETVKHGAHDMLEKANLHNAGTVRVWLKHQSSDAREIAG